MSKLIMLFFLSFGICLPLTIMANDLVNEQENDTLSNSPISQEQNNPTDLAANPHTQNSKEDPATMSNDPNNMGDQPIKEHKDLKSSKGSTSQIHEHNE